MTPNFELKDPKQQDKEQVNLKFTHLILSSNTLKQQAAFHQNVFITQPTFQKK